jgi:hypothetical protein
VSSPTVRRAAGGRHHRVGRHLWLPGASEQAALIEQARATAARQLQRWFPHWTGALEQLSGQALRQLACNQPVDPNDSSSWQNQQTRRAECCRATASAPAPPPG